jgi:hypothetical protein
MAPLACVGFDPPSESGLDETDRFTTSFSGTGSAHVHPPDAWQDHRYEGQPAPLSELIHPELPYAKVSRVQKWMTERELIELLGEPLRREVLLQDADTRGQDWNAWVFTWKFQDSRYTPVEMTRDLDVYLGYVHKNRGFPGRADVLGPEWVVIRWELN